MSANVVANRTDGVDVLSGGIVERPLHITFSGIDGAGVTASHQNHDIGRPDDVIGPRLGEFVGDIDADFGHHGDRRRIDLVGWCGAA